MSPIMVRPVREQFEHDRVIRLIQTRFRRRFDVGINPGMEQNVPIGTGPSAVYPDVVLTSPDRGRRVHAVIEVETTESVNNLEAMAQWVQFGRLRPAFHLYVPANAVDVAKRLCSANGVAVAEIQSYHLVGDQMRFLPVYKAPADSRGRTKVARDSRAAAVRPAQPKRAGAKAAKRPTAAASRTSRTKKPARAARTPARAAKRR